MSGGTIAGATGVIDRGLFAAEVPGRYTLLATAGDEPEWNSRHTSRGHAAIPLPSARIVERFPMIAQLIRQLGFDVADVVSAHCDDDQRARRNVPIDCIAKGVRLQVVGSGADGENGGEAYDADVGYLPKP